MKILPKLCIEYNEDNEITRPTKPILFSQFKTDNEDVCIDKIDTKSIDIQQDISILNKLLNTNDKEKSDISLFNKVLDTYANLLKNFDNSKLSQAQVDALKTISEIKF